MTAPTARSRSDRRAEATSRARAAGQPRRDEPFDVHIEFVVLDGEAGKELARRQAAVIRKVLRWFYDNLPSEHDAPGGTDEAAGSSV